MNSSSSELYDISNFTLFYPHLFQWTGRATVVSLSCHRSSGAQWGSQSQAEGATVTHSSLLQPARCPRGSAVAPCCSRAISQPLPAVLGTSAERRSPGRAVLAQEALLVLGRVWLARKFKLRLSPGSHQSCEFGIFKGSSLACGRAVLAQARGCFGEPGGAAACPGSPGEKHLPLAGAWKRLGELLFCPQDVPQGMSLLLV